MANSTCWESLSPPWQACLEEAWSACCAGTIPIGAVVTDAAGNILARGRNRIFDDCAPQGQVCQTELAHAELNALLALGIDRGDRREWALYTTTEPCPLCLGAFYMSGIRTLHYASRDPWAGSVNLLGTTPYLSRKPIRVFSPPQPALESFVAALFVAWEGRRHARLSVAGETLQTTAPQGVRLGQHLAESGELQGMITAGWPAGKVYDHLTGML